jgi:alpha-beta hydrolase superfamily lysophospholipase
VGGNLQGTQALLDRYRGLGVSRIDHKFYEGARHDVLNEINRDEVTRDVIDWLKQTM